MHPGCGRACPALLQVHDAVKQGEFSRWPCRRGLGVTGTLTEGGHVKAQPFTQLLNEGVCTRGVDQAFGVKGVGGGQGAQHLGSRVCAERWRSSLCIARYTGAADTAWGCAWTSCLTQCMALSTHQPWAFTLHTCMSHLCSAPQPTVDDVLFRLNSAPQCGQFAAWHMNPWAEGSVFFCRDYCSHMLCSISWRSVLSRARP